MDEMKTLIFIHHNIFTIYKMMIFVFVFVNIDFANLIFFFGLQNQSAIKITDFYNIRICSYLSSLLPALPGRDGIKLLFYNLKTTLNFF